MQNLFGYKLPLIFVLFTSVAMPPATGGASPPSPNYGPNFVMFYVDDMDKSDFACFDGAGVVLTPNIDQLASEGIKFQEAYVSSSVCRPSRYTFATGRHPSRSEYTPYLAAWPADTQGEPGLMNMGIGSDEQTVGHLLNAAGYFTGWVGKFHLGADDSKMYTSPISGKPVNEEDYTNDYASFVEAEYNSLKGGRAQAYLEGPLTDAHIEIENIVKSHIENNLGFDYADYIYRGNLDKPINAHNLEWTIKGALEFLDLSQNQLDGGGGVRPFYLHLNTTLLHGSGRQVTKDMDSPNFSGRGWLPDPIIIDPAYMNSRQEIRERVAAAGMDPDTAGVTWLDEGVGAVMKKLDALGLTDNTVFVFVPDHGTTNKVTLFGEDGCNVPLIVRYPAVMTSPGLNKGVECTELVQNIDFVPTIADLAGVPIPASYKMDGRSFRAFLEDPFNSQEIHDHLYFEIGHAKAILKDEFKYIVSRFSQGRIQEIQREIDLGSYGDLDYLPVTPVESLVVNFGYMGSHHRISARGLEYNPAYLDFDQVYDMGPRGNRKSMAEKTECADTKNLLTQFPLSPAILDLHESLKSVLEQDLQFLNADSGQTRPFGEFDTGFGPTIAPALTTEMLEWYHYLFAYYEQNSCYDLTFNEAFGQSSRPDLSIGLTPKRLVGNDIYNGSASGQKIRSRSKSGRDRSHIYYFAIQNDSRGTDAIRVGRDGARYGNRQWKAKVFSLAGGRENVTGAFERSEISRNLKSGEQTNFRVVVSSRRSGTTNPLSRSFSLKAVGGDGIGFDTARSQVTLRSRQSTVTTGKPGKLDDVFGSHP